MFNSEIVIIGGGAAGLFAAAIAAERGLQVTLLEKNSRCGRKIALTGKGRCNVTNTKPWEEFSKHIHPKNIFLKNAFFAMSNTKVMEFFEKIGLPLVVERGDRVFPQSMRAQDVTDALVAYITRIGGKIVTDCEVDKIEYEELDLSENPQKSDCNSQILESGGNNPYPNRKFRIISNGKTVAIAPNIIIATGGLSYPVTGSTGDGYTFAKALGHKVTECFPSLTALVPAGYSEMYHGISLKNVEVTLLVNNQPVATEFGDMDFTNGGIEGPIGFKISRKAVWNLKNGQKVAVLLDLKPAVTLEQVAKRIKTEIAALTAAQQQDINKNGAKAIARLLLPKLMPKTLIEPFLNTNTITLSNLAEKLKAWRFEITGNVGYERCVITAGGVSLAEVSQKTMESKLVKGLYFAGEVLDLDGDTGGYNLQIAFSTAALAANSIK